MKQLLFITVYLLAACSGGSDYVIKKGEHSSGAHLSPHVNQQVMTADVVLSESCKYTFPGSQWNFYSKIFGLSYGAHQEKSLRWGWRCRPNGQLEVTAYLHIDGEIVIPTVHWQKWQSESDTVEELEGPISVESNTRYRMCIVGKESNTIGYLMWDIDAAMWYAGYITDERFRDFKGAGYHLYPYFGGTEVAPHDVTVYVEWIDDYSCEDQIPE